LWPSITVKRATAGFTLIEALVALSIVALVLSSIAGLIASTARSARSIEDQLVLLETASTVINAIPDRNQLALGEMSGATNGHRWRLDVMPFVANDFGPQARAQWVPQLVVVTIQSAHRTKQFSTVRLRRRGGS